MKNFMYDDFTALPVFTSFTTKTEDKNFCNGHDDDNEMSRENEH